MATRSRSTGRASPATPGRSRTAISWTRCAGSRTRCGALGVGKGDRVNIYLGMVPELPIAMLACARIGAPHSVVFGGFSAEALRDRINDAEAKVLITADGAWRRGAVVPLKDNADAAVAECPIIEHVITVRRCGNEHAFTEGRDHWYHELVADQSTECQPEPMDAEDLLYLLYTSGTTGKPKGIAHTTGGYMTQVADDPPDDLRHPRRRRVLVRGRLRVGHRPQLHRLRTAREPHDGRDVRGRARTGPTRTAGGRSSRSTGPRSSTPRRPRSARSCDGGRSSPSKHDLSSLRLLGSVGEPINPEAWVWYWKVIGGERCPVVDTWWQTETGAIIDHAAAGRHDAEAGLGDVPVPGDRGRRRRRARGVASGSAAAGTSCCGIRGPRSRGRSGAIPIDTSRPTSRSTGPTSTSPATARAATTEGYYWLLGRIDDVMNVAGHRLSTFEIESALVDDDRRSPRRPSSRGRTRSRARGSSRS